MRPIPPHTIANPTIITNHKLTLCSRSLKQAAADIWSDLRGNYQQRWKIQSYCSNYCQSDIFLFSMWPLKEEADCTLFHSHWMTSTEWDKPVERIRLQWRITDELWGLYYSDRTCNGWQEERVEVVSLVSQKYYNKTHLTSFSSLNSFLSDGYISFCNLTPQYRELLYYIVSHYLPWIKSTFQPLLKWFKTLQKTLYVADILKAFWTTLKVFFATLSPCSNLHIVIYNY